ncbi:MAG: 30S ribosomal protein S2 [Candidatus Aenigmarchaeota archaeon]|nr:30S ribosomal protein S2 [Candidatus Aenigmarchaeota archaeon]
MIAKTEAKAKKEKLLIPREKYLSAGVHIGLTTKTADMKRFIYKIRPNGLAVLNVGMIDRRVGYAAGMLAGKKNILVVSRKENGQASVKKFAEVTGSKVIVGRFMPGTLTNPHSQDFFEPDVLVVTDPLADKQAIKEAYNMRIPIIGLVDTFNELAHLDFVIPCNNKGKKSLAIIYWLLAKLLLEKRGEKLEAKPEDFGYEE